MNLDYFIIEEDPRTPNIVNIHKPNLTQIILSIKHGTYDLLAESEVIVVEPGEFNAYPDVLSHQIFMVQKHIMEAIGIFHDDMHYNTMYLMDRVNRIMVPYYIPNLDFIQYSEVHCNNRKLGSIRIKRKDISQKNIFQLANNKKIFVVISLALAEVILRRSPKNILLTRVTVESEE